MINYIREQFLANLAHNTKKIMKHKGKHLKKNMPKNVSSKNALRIARYRNAQKNNLFWNNSNAKKKHPLVRELQHEVSTHKKTNNKLRNEMEELKHQLNHYQELYGITKTNTLHQAHRKQLQEIISLQRELIDNHLQTKELYKSKIISKKEYDKINSQLKNNEDKLRAKKQEILTS